ncbi:MAG: LpxI family protein [Rhodospirillaceae bacterium]|nr:MAG: LpxI family protein [Rhodospirillaceae bacterium]
MSGPSSADKLGIIAGGGTLPGLLAAACRADGRPYYLLGLTGFADARILGQTPDAWIRLGEAGQGFDRLRAADVSTVVMAGSVRRPTLAELRPDLRTAAFFARIAGRVLGDDSLMKAVIAELEREGFTVIGPEDILASLVARLGSLGRHKPDSEAEADIALGMKVAHELGRLDVGQAVVVQQGLVLGLEGIEGTAALISRCGELKRAGPGGVLVKMKKPQQDRRADLPVIGVETVTQAANAGLRGIAMEAGGSLILGAETVAAAADDLGLFVTGVAVHE